MSPRGVLLLLFIFSSGRSDMSESLRLSLPTSPPQTRMQRSRLALCRCKSHSPCEPRSNATRFETDQWTRVTFKSPKKWFSENRLRFGGLKMSTSANSFANASAAGRFRISRDEILQTNMEVTRIMKRPAASQFILFYFCVFIFSACLPAPSTVQ